jgi:hypothetical protein
VHSDLVAALGRHLTAVEDGRRAAEEAEVEAERAVGALEAVLAEAADAEVTLAGAERADRVREQLAADLAADRSAAAVRSAAALNAVTTELESEVEVLLDQMYATRLVVAAAVEALPAVGFSVLGDTVVQQGAAVAFQIERAGGAVLDLEVEPVDDGARLTYDGRAADYVVEPGPEGPVARCDLTEELLEQLHDELALHGVEAGELQWEGKPTRPLRRRGQAYGGAVRRPRSRE